MTKKKPRPPTDEQREENYRLCMHECENMRAEIGRLVAKVNQLASEVQALRLQLEGQA